MAASVWMKLPTSVTPVPVRASAETMPMVVVCPTPKGLPMASAITPISTLSELPSCREGRVPSPRSISGAVCGPVGEQHFGVEFAPVGQFDFDFRTVTDDVVVGHDQPLGRQDHAGAQRGLNFL